MNNIVNIINAIGSTGTFFMAIFYFFSLSIQLYQMRLGFKPALGFTQSFLVNQNGKLKLQDTSDLLKTSEEGINYFILHNLGGGTAKFITLEIYSREQQPLQKKYVHNLPSNTSYLLPINEKTYDSLNQALISENHEQKITIDIHYKSNASRKWKHAYLIAQIDFFNQNKEIEIYELQFVNHNKN